MNQREIKISEILEGYGSIKGLEGKITFRFSGKNLSDEDFSELIESLAFKLLKDKFRSKEAYSKNGSFDPGSLEKLPPNQRIIEIDLADFIQRKAPARINLSEMAPSDIAKWLKKQIGEEKISELLERL